MNTTKPAAEVLTDEDVARIAWDSYGTLRTRQEYQFARAIEAEVTRRLEGQAIDPDWLMLKAGQEALFDYLPDCTIEEREELSRDVFLAMLAAPSPEAAPVEMRSDFTDTSRAALMWVLWHHQGGSSPVGRPIRFALGMGQHEHLADWQIAEAKRWAALPAPERPHGGARWSVEEDTRRGMEWNRHIVDNHGRTVCFMAHSNGKDSAGDAQRAYLVAAAPALLDALRELVRICENCDAEQSTANAPSEDEYQAAMNDAEEAIAWAGGEYGY